VDADPAVEGIDDPGSIYRHCGRNLATILAKAKGAQS
jgi:hypothetical protein